MKQELQQAVATAVKDLFDLENQPELTRPDEQFGDFATNVALQITKEVGENPREIATKLQKWLIENREDLEKVDVAGPGFLNMTLKPSALLAFVKQLPTQSRRDQSVVIETNNPNPFKAMHIGHAMNAITADTIANLLSLSAAHTFRVSYHGDIGLHVGKSMYSLLAYTEGDIAKLEAIPAAERNTFMSKMYASGSAAYKDDPVAKEEIDKLAAESFAPQSAHYAAVYELCKAWSFDQIDKTVARIGNQPTVYRFLESDADAKGVDIVKKNTPKVFEQSDGAYIFRGSKYGSFDNVFVASNGHGLYGARDLGLMRLKNEQFHPVKSYIVTGGEQAQYFKGVIAAAGLVNPSQKDQTVNIPTGLAKLTTGKMSSRSGDVIEIDWLFNEFGTAIVARGGEPADEIVAGALRYQFLKIKIGGDVVFDVAEAVALTGNTGSYLQYAHARARRILEKINASVAFPDTVKPEDRTLVRFLGQYAEVVDQAVALLEPHHICTYLFELAQEFNRYYEQHTVVGSDQEAHRAGLVAVYADILKAGLTVLGIHAPDKM